MNNTTNPYHELSDESIFLVWGPPSHGPRSQVFSKKLAIKDVHFIHSITKRGFLSALFRYSYQAIKTLSILFNRQPKIVFIQSPPAIAILFVYIYCKLKNSHYVVDAHSAALQLPYWIRPAWFYGFLARNAVTTIVTNEHFAEFINKWGANAFVLRDIPTTFPDTDTYPVESSFNVVVVNTFAADEPLDEVLAAAAKISDVQFYITGKKKQASPQTLAKATANVHFTDFLPNESYYALLNSSQAVMCLTTRNHTMQRGACEALSLGKPIVTSNWPLLQNYFHKGTVHVDNTTEGIEKGVLEIKERYQHYQAGIKDLQLSQQQEWQDKITALVALIKKAKNS